MFRCSLRAAFFAAIAVASLSALSLAGVGVTPAPALADVAKCPCGPPAVPDFPEIDRPTYASASPWWVIFWEIFHNW